MEYPVITIDIKSANYPERLKQIGNPPRQLYCRGDISLLQTECFGVVGTRMITSYGKEAVQQFVPGLARHFTIVSGLAIGIDASAHKRTLETSGKTIAVLGSGINDKHIYPVSNQKLAHEILENGGLITSEYKPDTKARDNMFPERNRIISGLSKGVLIIEADDKSGSLITARLAVEQNRDVFAVPGSIFSPKSRGTNQLIQRGAKLVSTLDDIIQDYSMLDLKLPARNANPTEASILAVLETNGPLNTDEIIRHTQKEAPEIMVALSMMEIKGMVRQMANGIFRKAD
ncbi:MAG: DNA protecting protein DprA [Candidatus Yanofskybacteria bacterium RIFCSPHIGHO2_02_FULL_50_12]|uniref:DNA protecting protein DprA n=1 Tax=Candidatus Yanofskybacteria bacterium RIFCSPHIGHO2_02_FULL_50_12 TaxID=1802685 RepID=A0A1F8FXK7_9BACT|nr:MAG: DNA protecting protein DprA [Candidatus Yanofskybacteria bacterium RIFCSPHIGHO2_02_FULL_50_12]